MSSSTLSVGIVGLPNVGKSTLFAALTKKQVDIANYPFCTIEKNVGIVRVPDERLQKLTELFHSEKTIPTVIEFVDIAGLVRGANKGEGLGNQFLAEIREVKAILQVVRCFEDSDIAHVEESIDPLRDIEIIETELLLKDLDTVKKRIFKAEKEIRSEDKKAKAQYEILLQLQSALSNGTTAFKFMEQNEGSEKVVLELQLLSSIPILYILNCKGDKAPKEVEEKIKSMGSLFVALNVKDEFEYAGFTLEEMEELGAKERRLPLLITKAYEMLNLITFFTTGSDETRAWTIEKGDLAPVAAGVIHTDFRDKFIKAVVVQWDKLIKAGGLAEAMAQGLIRTEGKDYVVKDGDVIEVKHG
ncbi:MAG TPA: redox-regulated ATPase YchF [Candidatus Wildermuthbacteria bacterium]|nr:redox-regulated ATPase YchF [Candidatus Wildermuthbacteria bacterium]